VDLRDWNRDVRAYFRALEQTLIDALATLGVRADRLSEPGCEGVWVNDAKIAAIGVHISRWITSHGFALNVDTDLNFFKYIVPCGLHRPVCSLRSLGLQFTREEVQRAIADSFRAVFGYETVMANAELQETR
jgi:lipoate-protein ligase B